MSLSVSRYEKNCFLFSASNCFHGKKNFTNNVPKHLRGSKKLKNICKIFQKSCFRYLGELNIIFINYKIGFRRLIKIQNIVKVYHREQPETITFLINLKQRNLPLHKKLLSKFNNAILI